MSTPTKPRRKRGRPPKPIPDTPENVARALLSTPPKKRDEWDYLKQSEGRPADVG